VTTHERLDVLFKISEICCALNTSFGAGIFSLSRSWRQFVVVHYYVTEPHGTILSLHSLLLASENVRRFTTHGLAASDFEFTLNSTELVLPRAHQTKEFHTLLVRSGHSGTFWPADRFENNLETDKSVGGCEVKKFQRTEARTGGIWCASCSTFPNHTEN
jgi:hypothetical protein